MRLLIVGSDKIYAIENIYVKYLKQLGCEVDHFPIQSLFHDYYHKNFLNKIIYRSGLSGIHKILNQRLVECVDEYKPELIWVFKGMEVLPSTLEIFRHRKIKLVNYNPDNPFIFTGDGSGNDHVKNSIGLYDLHFTYNLEVKKQLEREFKIPTAYLPFGFDVSEKLFDRCNGQDEIVKACFLGNPDKNRADFIVSLAKKNIEIDLYGNGWHKFVSDPKLKIHPVVSGDDFWETLHRYRVQLNVMRIHNEDSHNMRSFEIPGIAGIQVAPATTEHRMFFENEKEIFLYESVEQCATMVRELLAMPLAQSQTIRQNARRRSIESKYTYKDRAKEVKSNLERLLLN